MMIVEQVFAALVLINNQGVSYLLLHVCCRDEFVLSIALHVVPTIALELRVLKLYRSLTRLILGRYRLYVI